jgi:hypothetical protein
MMLAAIRRRLAASIMAEVQRDGMIGQAVPK